MVRNGILVKCYEPPNWPPSLGCGFVIVLIDSYLGGVQSENMELQMAVTYCALSPPASVSMRLEDIVERNTVRMYARAINFVLASNLS